jgi:hypothetical protein
MQLFQREHIRNSSKLVLTMKYVQIKVTVKDLHELKRRLNLEKGQPLKLIMMHVNSIFNIYIEREIHSKLFTRLFLLIHCYDRFKS